MSQGLVSQTIVRILENAYPDFSTEASKNLLGRLEGNLSGAETASLV